MQQPVAHTPNAQGQWHTLSDHSCSVARRTALFALKFQAEGWAERLGLVHDAGKIAKAWQDRLKLVSGTRERVGIDHWSAGMVWLLQERGPDSAFCALSAFYHHGGLGNFGSWKTRAASATRNPDFLDACVQAQGLLGPHYPVAVKPLPPVFKNPATRGLAIRMLHSCLIDSDCLDTEAHFQDPGLRGCAIDLTDLLTRFEADQKAFQGLRNDPLDALRSSIYNEVMGHATAPPGFFSLPAKTGLGKTRTAMGFALAHALAHGKDRVIVAIPYTSVVEQTVGVYRGIFGKEAVLEHQSQRDQRANTPEQEKWQRMTSQNWDAPIVVTTHVQFFESLFASRNRRIRKLHNIVNSVIILDEIQTLPSNLFKSTLIALRALVEDFGCTVVFSTATPPPFGVQDLPASVQPYAIPVIKPLIADQPPLNRVQAHLLDPLDHGVLAKRIQNEVSSLTIVNTIKDAFLIFDLLRDPTALLLTSRMCGAHKTATLKEITARLESRQPCTVVATQCAETGIDLDFPVVHRAMAPFERIVQASGRCNRHSKITSGQFYVFELDGGKYPDPGYETNAGITRGLLKPGFDLEDPALFKSYYDKWVNASVQPVEAILLWENHLQFEEVGDHYRFIADPKVDVLVPWPGTDASERLKISEAIRLASLDQLRWRDMQDLQPFMVGLFPDQLKNPAVKPLGTQGLLSVWTGAYDPVRGIVL